MTAQPASLAWREQLADALERLPTDQRSVLQLVYGARLSQAEVARLLAQPLTTVRSMLARALQDLATAIGD